MITIEQLRLMNTIYLYGGLHSVILVLFHDAVFLINVTWKLSSQFTSAFMAAWLSALKLGYGLQECKYNYVILIHPMSSNVIC